MSAQHTPGPWETDGLTITAAAAMFSERRVPIAQLTHFVPENERKANAALMTAANEQHHLLESFTEWARQIAERADLPAGIRQAASRLHADGAALIAKATGSAS